MDRSSTAASHSSQTRLQAARFVAATYLHKFLALEPLGHAKEDCASVPLSIASDDQASRHRPTVALVAEARQVTKMTLAPGEAGGWPSRVEVFGEGGVQNAQAVLNLSACLEVAHLCGADLACASRVPVRTGQHPVDRPAGESIQGR